MTIGKVRLLAFGASLLSLAIASEAFAQDTSPKTATVPENAQDTQPRPTAANAQDDIIVTSSRRAERLDKVPTAVTVIAGADLKERGIANINDLSNQVPALSISNNGFLSFVNIRGVGLQTTNPSTSSGIAIYSDGMFIAHETTIGDGYFDVSQIEVLRGPQGTFVGQSSTGGAMFVNSVKPSFDRVKGYMEGTIGNYGNYRAEAAINIPLSGTLAVRLAGHVDTKDSFYTNIAPGSNRDPGNMRGYAARIGIRWTPSDRFDLYIKSELGDRHGDGYPGKPFGEIAGTAPSVIAHPALRDPFTIDYNSPTFDKYEIWKTVAEINYKISDNITLRSLTGYQRQHSNLAFDNDLGPVANQTLLQHFTEYTVQQEINLISNNKGPFNWIVGGFFLRDSLPNILDFNVGPVKVYIDSQPVERSYAAFGQFTYNFTSKWQLQLGGRYNVNRKRLGGFETTTIVGPNLMFSEPLTSRADANELTGKVALNYFLDEHTTLYISASRGFKAGGTNTVAPLNFAPEKVNAFEAGFKARPLPGLRLSGAGFYYDYKNMQISLLSTDPVAAAQAQSAITNVPKSTIYGLEFEANAQLGHLALDASASYTHSRIDELVALDYRNAAAGSQDLSGRELAFAPKWTLKAGATYTVPVTFGSIALHGQYSYVSDQYATPFQLILANYSPLNGFGGANDLRAGHNLVDAQLSLNFKNSVAVEIYGTNLTNKVYAIGTALNLGAVLGSPRQYGMRLRYTF